MGQEEDPQVRAQEDQEARRRPPQKGPGDLDRRGDREGGLRAAVSCRRQASMACCIALHGDKLSFSAGGWAVCAWSCPVVRDARTNHCALPCESGEMCTGMRSARPVRASYI